PNDLCVVMATLAAGLLTLCGALTYARLGARFPRAGGLSGFLREAYRPGWGFAYAWTAFAVILVGGLPAIPIGFARFFGTFVPFLSPSHVFGTIRVGSMAWQPSGGALASTLAIVVLTGVNHVGLRSGARLQGALTAIEIAAILALGAVAVWRGGAQETT